MLFDLKLQQFSAKTGLNLSFTLFSWYIYVLSLSKEKVMKLAYQAVKILFFIILFYQNSTTCFWRSSEPTIIGPTTVKILIDSLNTAKKSVTLHSSHGFTLCSKKIKDIHLGKTVKVIFQKNGILINTKAYASHVILKPKKNCCVQMLFAIF